jgi:hypothetical protein
MTKPTRERLALDRLLAIYRTFDVLHVDWQLPSETGSAGPWLLVELGQRSDNGVEAWARHRFAIWKATGATHGVGSDGAVLDPPLLEGMA